MSVASFSQVNRDIITVKLFACWYKFWPDPYCRQADWPWQCWPEEAPSEAAQEDSQWLGWRMCGMFREIRLYQEDWTTQKWTHRTLMTLASRKLFNLACKVNYTVFSYVLTIWAGSSVLWLCRHQFCLWFALHWSRVGVATQQSIVETIFYSLLTPLLCI